MKQLTITTALMSWFTTVGMAIMGSVSALWAIPATVLIGAVMLMTMKEGKNGY